MARFAIVREAEAGWLCGTGCLRIRLNSREIDGRYLRYYLGLDSTRAWLEQHARGVTMANTNASTLRGLPLRFPGLAGQLEIAGVLEKAEEVRQKRGEASALAERLLRSTFNHMFGGPGRWPEVRLGETLLVRPQIGTTRPARADGACPVVRVGELGGREVEVERCGRVTLSAEEAARFACAAGDVLLARAIGSEQHLGKASVVEAHAEPLVFDSHVMRLRFDPTRVRPGFFYHWLASDGGRARFLRRAGRTAVQFNVNAEQIAEVVLPLPPLAEQDRWGRFEQQTRRLALQLRAAERASQALLDSLVQRVFAGQA